MTESQKRRRYDNFVDPCPMTPEQIRVMLANQEKLMIDVAALREDNSEIKKYLFAGRVVVATFVFIALTLDWTRDHVSFLKVWLTSK